MTHEACEGEVFALTILPGSHTASELVKQGNYDSSDDSITDKRFPIGENAPRTRTLELVEFDYDPSTEEVLAEFERRGLEPPDYVDALYFGIQYPEEQRKRLITVFLHEPVRVPGGNLMGTGGYGFLEISGNRTWRTLRLVLYPRRWSRTCVFAAVRK